MFVTAALTAAAVASVTASPSCASDAYQATLAIHDEAPMPVPDEVVSLLHTGARVSPIYLTEVGIADQGRTEEQAGADATLSASGIGKDYREQPGPVFQRFTEAAISTGGSSGDLGQQPPQEEPRRMEAATMVSGGQLPETPVSQRWQQVSWIQNDLRKLSTTSCNSGFSSSLWIMCIVIGLVILACFFLNRKADDGEEESQGFFSSEVQPERQKKMGCC
mmetsp:Transcript_24544/g.47733  ORF Transcript_24544/g.47733 Transcript_24544/m.47733 type:complete len:220 (-) Transcript_24544:47-706(-)